MFSMNFMRQAEGAWQPFATGARYAVATLGPLSASGVHFLAAILMLRALEPAEFGLFAFILAVVQFGFGLSNALIGTPFAVNANLPGYVAEEGNLFFKANLLLSLGVGFFCGAIAWAMGGGAAAPLFGAYAAFAVLRWFFRSYFYALHQAIRAAVSDVVYAIVLLAALGYCWKTGLTLENAGAAFAVAALSAGLTVGWTCLRIQFKDCMKALGGGYRKIWLEQSRWTLVGVTSTEATVNAHVWFVSILFGPAAFAPLAAASLLFRPVSLVVSSLTQLERPVISRALSSGDKGRALRAVSYFRVATVAAWCVAALMAAAILVWLPEFVIKKSYDMSVVILAVILQAGIAALLAWRGPDSALIQAANRFAPLARASVVSSLVSIPLVIIMLALFDPVWSLMAILVAQIVMAHLIAKLVSEIRDL